jgi:PKD repeat protein
MKQSKLLPMLFTVLLLIPVILVCQPPDINLMHKQGIQKLEIPPGNDGNLFASSNEIAFTNPTTTAGNNVYTEKSVQELAGGDNSVKISKASPGGPSPNLTDNAIIRWDNGINSGKAGINGGGLFDVAAYFPAATMEQFTGMNLNQVEIYIGDSPISCTLKVYGQGTSNSPGTLIYSQPVTTTPDSWNLITLATPVYTDGQDLWISYSLNHLDATFPAGIDAGPATAGYGDMISFNGGAWNTLSAMGYSYNWNIGGYLGEDGVLCPAVYAGPDASICEGDVYSATNALATNYSGLQWYTPNGTGTFDDANILNPIYTPSLQDYLLGSVDLCLIAHGIAPCEDAEDCIVLTFFSGPIVSAGDDALICATETYLLHDATASNYSSLFWDKQSGDGYFITPTSLNPIYVPGPGDIAAGSVELCLIASPTNYSFFPVIDCMTLTIDLQPETCCCPEFVLKDAVEICPPPGACDYEWPTYTKNAYYDGPSMAACKEITHNYTVYPNDPGLYNYSWEITGGTPLNYSGNPIPILWGSSNRGYIKVIITGEYCNDTIIQEVCLVDGPEANFEFSPNPVCIHSQVNFLNTSVGGSTYHWDFGNGMVSTKFDPSPISYNEPGTYTIVLSVTNSFSPDSALLESIGPCGCIDIVSKTITVLDEVGPVIETECCYGSVCPGGSSSFFTSADCSSYDWSVIGGVISFGDNTNSITVNWDAAYPGVPTTVTLELPDCVNVPCPGSTTIIVPVIYDSYPVNGPETICENSSGTYSLPVWPGTYYTWTVTALPYRRYQFNKEDRNVADVNISFFNAGTYEVKCEYSNPMIGCGGTTTFMVAVLRVLSFSGYDEVCEGSTEGYSANGNVAWSVIPIDGVIISPSTGYYTNVTWSLPGEYVLTATPVSPGIFCNESSFKVIHVIEKPILGEIEGLTMVCPGKNQTYSITSNVEGSPFEWAIGAGNGILQSEMGADKDSLVVQWTGIGPWQLKVRQARQLLSGYCESDWKVINVAPFAAPTLGGINTVCVDEVVTYTAGGPVPPGGIQWSVLPSGKGTIITGNGTSSVDILWHGGGSSTGQVIAEHCGGSDLINVTVNEPPPTQVTSTPEHPVFCLSESFNLTLSSPSCPGCSYQWYRNGSPVSLAWLNSISLSDADFTSPGKYEYYIEVKRNDCTAKSDAVIVEIMDCEGSCPGGGGCLAHAWFWTYQDCEKVHLINKSEPIGNINSGSYVWSVVPAVGTTFAFIGRDAELTVSTSGTYKITLTITDINGCTVSWSKQVLILLPTAGFSTSSPACVDEPVIFVPVPNNPDLNYYWVFGDGYKSYTAITEHAYTNPGTYGATLIITDKYGCTAEAGEPVLVKPKTPCTIVASDTHFCPGDFVTLTASGGLNSYQWFKDYEPMGEIFNPLTVDKHGEYYVEVTNNYGCTSISNSIYIYMHPSPVAKITGETYVCSGNSFYLETQYNGTYSYNWSEVSGTTGAVFYPIYGNPASVEVVVPEGITGQYIFSVIVTDNTTGCQAMDFICVTINETPELSFVPQTICEGDPITLSPNPNDPDTYFYQWSNGQTDPEITVSTPGEYWLTISNKLTGCNASAYAATIYPKPDLTLFPYGCKTICKGEQIEFYIPLPLNSYYWWQLPNSVNEAYPSIEWYNQEGNLLGIGETLNFTANSNHPEYHEISVIVQNYHGCRDTAGVFCLSASKCCPAACVNFDDGLHNFISYNEYKGIVTSPPIIVIEQPGSGGYIGDLGVMVTDAGGDTWIYNTSDYGGNYLECDEYCLCWDMNVVTNNTSYYPGIYLFKGFDPSQPISTTNPEFSAKFTSNSWTGLDVWAHTCATIKPSPNGIFPPESADGAWQWESTVQLDWNDFIRDIQGIMFRVEITGWTLENEKIRYDNICLGCSLCPKDTTICCDTTIILSTPDFSSGIFSGPYVSKVGDNYKFKMGCENFPTPSPPDYESFSQDIELVYEYTDPLGYFHDCYFTLTVDYKTPPPPDCPPLDTIVCLTSEPFWHGIIYIDPAELGIGTHYFDCFWTNACGTWQWDPFTFPPTTYDRIKVTVLAEGVHPIPDVTVCKSDPPFWHWGFQIVPGQYQYGSTNPILYPIPPADYKDPCGNSVSGVFNVHVREFSYICETTRLVMPDQWFIASSYVKPIQPFPSPDPSPIIDIFEPEIYLGHFEVALGKNGILWPSGSINTIGNWDVYQAYKIKMNEPGWIEIKGVIPEDKTINLNPGANYIPVLSAEYYSAGDIFDQLGNGLIFAYDLSSESLYWPAGGIYMLEVLEPGKGYLVGMSQPGQATYDPLLKSDFKDYVPVKPKVYENAPWKVGKSGSPHLISIERSALAGFDPGDFIGVFNAEGMCAGMSRIDKSESNLLLVAYGNDFTEKAATGLADGEAMQFRIYRASTMDETHAAVTFDASMPNMGLFTENGLSKIMKIKTGATSVCEAVLTDIQIYPNPSDGTFTISGIDGMAAIRIINILGDQVYFGEVDLPSKIDLSSQPQGVYFISIETDNSKFFKKLVIN